MKLTDKQIRFLIEKFFARKSHLPDAERIANIANELLITGICIVAGDGCIWHGSVGKFIRVEHAPQAVGCSLLRFDLAGFLSSRWAQECITRHEAELKAKIEDLQGAIVVMHDLARMGQNEPLPPANV